LAWPFHRAANSGVVGVRVSETDRVDLEGLVLALDGFDAVVEAGPADRRDAPSPCDGWSAADVAGHVIADANWPEKKILESAPVDSPEEFHDVGLTGEDRFDVLAANVCGKVGRPQSGLLPGLAAVRRAVARAGGIGRLATADERSYRIWIRPEPGGARIGLVGSSCLADT
jgi:hypothetical protein